MVECRMLQETYLFSHLRTSTIKISCFRRVILVVSWLVYLITLIEFPVVVVIVTSYSCCHQQFFQRRSYFAIQQQRGMNHIFALGSVNIDDVDPIVVTFPIHTNTTLVDQYFMQRALHQAQCASHLYSEVPIGAIVVRNITTFSTTTLVTSNDPNQAQHSQHQMYEILSEQHNRVEMNYDASAHAEMLALRDAARNIQNWRLNSNTRSVKGDNNTKNITHNSQTILYCTLEPCIMCFAAAHAFRIDQLVYGAPDIRLGACESYVTMVDITTSASTKHPYHTISDITSGIYANESSTLLRNFFRQRRQQQQQLRSPMLPLQQHQPQRPLPKEPQQQQHQSLLNVPPLLDSLPKPLPLYRRLWKQLVLRLR